MAAMTSPIRVFLADDQELVRSGFRMLIEAEDDLVVVGEAPNGAETLAALARLAADVVLMDIRMPVMDGVEATRRIVASGLATKVLVLTTFDLDEYVFSALKAGASGFLLKDARPAELLSAIRTVAAGEAVMAPSATRRLLDHVVPTLPTGPAGAAYCCSSSSGAWATVTEVGVAAAAGTLRSPPRRRASSTFGPAPSAAGAWVRSPRSPWSRSRP